MIGASAPVVPAADQIIKDIMMSKSTRINIPELIVKRLVREGFSEAEALCKCDGLKERVKQKLHIILKRNEIQRTQPTFELDRSNDDNVILLANVPVRFLGQDTATVVRLRPQMLEIVRRMTWRQFEGICSLVLEVNGGTGCLANRGRMEGGVDAFGWLQLESEPPPSDRILRGLRLRLIGQGKHSSSAGAISNDDVSEFVTDVQKIRSGTGRASITLPSDFATSSAPVVPIIMTNIEYCPDAIATAKHSSIIYLGGEQICEDLLRHPDLESWLDDSQDIDEARFLAYVDRRLQQR